MSITVLAFGAISPGPAHAGTHCQQHGNLANTWVENRCTTDYSWEAFNYQTAAICADEISGENRYWDYGNIYNSRTNPGWSRAECGWGYVISDHYLNTWP
ncbi:hypothetical protein Aph01nite_15360 [Acrocarpospora phusangensis]|uniref:Uncharacterized protein n=1 Tax=Acrocarpospora phusangensis TaxID=1070424 RepID=A0A919Q800_9ACTN|nr:hypothetical protein [Acrocarpospora phusangensis]GIH23226.1 hypothetical protein Aph01nite_15360 [Acrocarpospora phusangensis]